MIDLGKYNLLGILINAVDYDAVVARVVSSAKLPQSLTVSALAVHGVMTGVQDPVHRYRLNHIDLVVPDGQPIRWALSWLYKANLTDRVYGPNLMLRVCAQAAQERLPIFLYGSKLETLEKLQANLSHKFPDLTIAGTQASLFRQISNEEKKNIARKIIESGARVVFVGLGCPRQEVWVYEYSQELSLPILAVGAAFDFHAGTISQAPLWMQLHGFEWLYRFSKEPKRLWKRYLLLNPLFVLFLICQKLRFRSFNVYSAVPPSIELRYG